MAALRRLGVFCGSSNRAPAVHLELARRLGRMLAERGVELVYGGGRVGLMGAVAEAAMTGGARVIGVIPQHLEDREAGYREIDEYLVVDSMHARKQRMYELSDAFCILPGGLGTLDEAFEVITWKLLRLHDKPIVLLDGDGYWQPLLALIRHQRDSGYIGPACERLFACVGSLDQVFEAIAAAPAPRIAADSEAL